MITELILSILTLVTSVSCSIATIVVTFKIGKLNNLEARHKYDKEITPFELEHKDKQWVLDLVKNEEFGNYSQASQQIIIAWYNKLVKQEEANKTKKETVDPAQIKVTVARANSSRTTKKPNKSTGRAIVGVMNGIDAIHNIKGNIDTSSNNLIIDTITEVPIDSVSVKKQPKKVEITFDDILDAATYGIATKKED